MTRKAQHREAQQSPLEPPFPQAPKSQGKPYCVYFSHDDAPGRMGGAMPVRALYAGHHLIQHIIKQQGPLFDYDKGDILFESGWRISTRKDYISAQDLHNYTLTAKESEWQFPLHMLPAVARPKRTAPDEGMTFLEPKKQRDKKPKVERAPRPSKEGFISIADIATELGKTPQQARAALRGNIDKPAEGWAWKPDDKALDKIRKLIKEAK